MLLFFAFVPPSSINSCLDTQRSVHEVLKEIAFAAGAEGEFCGISYEAIGIIWFLPCLFIARVVFNELLLLARRIVVPGKRRSVVAAGVVLAALSLTILCVHRIESAIFNWQKIMEFFCPDVWGWGLTAQGLYQFGMRAALVVAIAVLVVHMAGVVRARRAQRTRLLGASARAHLARP